MKIATVINAHKDPDLVRDTIDSVATYSGKNIIVVIDSASWSLFKNEDIPAGKIEGFYHKTHKAPYRNVALGIKTLVEQHPDCSWYCYCEPDVLFVSDIFKQSLKVAEDKKVWMLGNDGHIARENLNLIQSMLKTKINSSYYLLGCCLFFHKDFIIKLKEINFFERFLNLTNSFSEGFFPFYSGYDISEHLYPTLCRHFGGNIGVFAHYDENKNWHGSYKNFPIRWKPELDPETENYSEACIMHPIKSFDHPIRVLHREKRKLWKNLKKKENQSA